MIWFLKIFAVLSMSLARISNRNLLIWTIFEKWSGTAVWIFWRFMDPSEVGSEWKFGDIVPNRIAWSTLYSVAPPHSTFSTRKIKQVALGMSFYHQYRIFGISWECSLLCNVLHFIQLSSCHSAQWISNIEITFQSVREELPRKIISELQVRSYLITAITINNTAGGGWRGYLACYATKTKGNFIQNHKSSHIMSKKRNAHYFW